MTIGVRKRINDLRDQLNGVRECLQDLRQKEANLDYEIQMLIKKL